MSPGLDFMPGNQISGRRVRAKLIRWVAIGAACVAASAAVGWAGQKRTERNAGEVTTLEMSVEGLRMQTARAPELAGRLSQAREEQRRTNALLGEPDWTGLLGDIARATGGGIILNDLLIYQETKKSEPDSEEKRTRNLVRLAGSARSNSDVVRFMDELSSSELLIEIDLANSTRGQDPDDEFGFEFDVRGVAIRAQERSE